MSLWERLRSIRKGPLAVAGLLGAPLFFCSLMAASLAIARPRIVTWTHDGKLVSRFHAPAASVEARIWLWALVPLAIMLAVGLIASLWRFGGFVSCAAGIVLAFAVTHRVNDVGRATTPTRWPRGIDNIPDKWSSDQVPRGAWEKDAAQSAFSLSHWTIGLAFAIVLVYLLLIVPAAAGSRPGRADRGRGRRRDRARDSLKRTQMARVNLEDIPVVATDEGRWQGLNAPLGITGFGINALTTDTDEATDSAHDESESGQEELYIVVAGTRPDHGRRRGARGGGRHARLRHRSGASMRSFRALEDGTRIVCIGARPGTGDERYGEWIVPA